MVIEPLSSRCVAVSRGGSILAWDGKAWTPAQPQTQPGPLANWAWSLVANPDRASLLLFGGGTNGADDQLWEWDGTDWRDRGTSPSRTNLFRDLMQAAYHPDMRRVACIGGGSPHTYNTTFTFTFPIPTAHVYTFGKSCGPILQSRNQGRPVLGTTLDLEISSLPTSQPRVLLAAGVSNRWFSGFPLPVPLDVLGMPGCQLHQSYDLSWWIPRRNGIARDSLGIPNTPGLMGATLTIQAAVPGQTSNALELQFGTQCGLCRRRTPVDPTCFTRADSAAASPPTWASIPLPRASAPARRALGERGPRPADHRPASSPTCWRAHHCHPARIRFRTAPGSNHRCRQCWRSAWWSVRTRGSRNRSSSSPSCWA